MTWHQQKAQPKLWHETKWTVVVDPPHGCCALYRFTSKTTAKEFLAKCPAHSYILPPAKL